MNAPLATASAITSTLPTNIGLPPNKVHGAKSSYSDEFPTCSFENSIETEFYYKTRNQTVE